MLHIYFSCNLKFYGNYLLHSKSITTISFINYHKILAFLKVIIFYTSMLINVETELNLHDFYRTKACTPTKRFYKIGWNDTFKNQQNIMNQLRPNNLIIGDSIVNGLWYQQISSSFLHQTSNLGIGGDRVEHVLWRMENLDIPTSVENVILQCGTNSLGKNSPNDIANSIICIALTAIKRKPSINVIIMGILPRNERNSVNRMLIKKVNNLICQYCTKVKNEVNIFLYHCHKIGYYQLVSLTRHIFGLMAYIWQKRETLNSQNQ